MFTIAGGMQTDVYFKSGDGEFFMGKCFSKMLAYGLPLWKEKLASKKFSEEVRMRKKGLINTIVVMMLLFTVYSTMAIPLKAAVEQNGEQDTKCFAQFEKCIQNVRTSFWGGMVDFLDCELALARCIKKALLN